MIIMMIIIIIIIYKEKERHYCMRCELANASAAQKGAPVGFVDFLDCLLRFLWRPAPARGQYYNASDNITLYAASIYKHAIVYMLPFDKSRLLYTTILSYNNTSMIRAASGAAAQKRKRRARHAAGELL